MSWFEPLVTEQLRSAPELAAAPQTPGAART